MKNLSINSDAAGHGLRAIGLVLLSLAVSAAAGCRSKLDVKSKDGGEAPVVETPEPLQPPVVEPPPPDDGSDEDDPPPGTPDPVQKDNALEMAGGKFYFQSRDVITLTIKKELLEGADSFSVLNVTNPAGVNKKLHNIPLVQEDLTELGLRSAGGYALAGDSEGNRQIQFFPGEDDWQGKFFYLKDKNGQPLPNKLKVIAHDDVNPRFAIMEIWLSDFEVFGVAVTAFENDMQVMTVEDEEGGTYQFQGWVNILSEARVTSEDKKTVLTNGIFNMVNP